MELGVLKSFEFVSQLRRASVVVRQFGKKSGDIFVKGAPEAMREICDPESCEDLLRTYRIMYGFTNSKKSLLITKNFCRTTRTKAIV